MRAGRTPRRRRGAVTAVPSTSVTPRTASPSQSIAVTRVDGAQRAARGEERAPARRRASPRCRRPAGRPAPRAASRATSAPSPVPGISGLMPHTIGPPTGAGAGERVVREERPQHVGGAAPAPAQQDRGAREPSCAGRSAVSAVRRRRLVGRVERSCGPPGSPPAQVAPVAVDLAGQHAADRVERGARRRGGASTTCRRPTPCGAAPARRPGTRRPWSAETELVDHRRRAERDVVAVADVDGRTAERARWRPCHRRCRVPRRAAPSRPARARYAAVISPLCPAPMTIASWSSSARRSSGFGTRPFCSFHLITTNVAPCPDASPTSAHPRLAGALDRSLDRRAAARCDRAARPAPAVQHRLADRRAGRRGSGRACRRRARRVAAAGAGVHEVERARLVGRHDLAVARHAADGARRHRPLRRHHAGPQARVLQRPRRQLGAASASPTARSGSPTACRRSSPIPACRPIRVACRRPRSSAWASTAAPTRRR